MKQYPRKRPSQNEGNKDLGVGSHKRGNLQRSWSRKSQSKKSAKNAKPSVESIAEKLRPKVMGQPTPNKADDRPILEVSSGGLILVEKVNEHLDAIRMAHKSRLAAQMEIPKKLQEYPNPLEEKVNLVVHMQMIRETQAILEGRPKLLTRGSIFLKPSLETIPKVTSSAERGSKPGFPSVVAKSQQQEEETLDHEHNEKQPLNATDFGDEIPELEETMAKEMWDVVQQRIDEESPSLKSPPFSIVDFTGRQSIEVDAMPYNEDEG